MEQIPSGRTVSAFQEVHRLLLHLNYRVHKSPLLIHILDKITPIRTYTPHFLRSPEWFRPMYSCGFQVVLSLLSLPTKYLSAYLIFPTRDIYPS
jgi:hypothetical protein